jgi:hypothetical protein
MSDTKSPEQIQAELAAAKEAAKEAKRVQREAEKEAKRVQLEAEKEAKRQQREAEKEAKRVRLEAERDAKRQQREADKAAAVAAKQAAKEAAKRNAVEMTQRLLTQVIQPRLNELHEKQPAFESALEIFDSGVARAVFWDELRANAQHGFQVAENLANAAFVAHCNNFLIAINGMKDLLVASTVPSTIGEQNGPELLLRAMAAEIEAAGYLGCPPDGMQQAFNMDQKVAALAEKKMLDIWKKSASRRQAFKVAFFPPPLKMPEAKVYNTYYGPAIPRGVGNAAAATEFINHVMTRICNNDEGLYKWVMTWMATLVQRPGEKVRSALALRGQRGCGKGTLYNVLSAIVGRQYCKHPSGAEQVVGRFNGCIADALLIFMDELVWAGSHAEEGVLKKLVTEDVQQVEFKTLEARPVLNVAHVLIATNEDWCVPAGAGERRFTVVDVSNELSVNKPLGKQVHENLMASIEDIAALLYTWPLDAADLNSCYETDALQEQKENSLRGIDRWVADQLEIGDYWGEEIPKARVYERFKNTAEGRHTAAAVFTRRFNVLLGNPAVKSRGQRGAQVEHYVLPTRTEALEKYRVVMRMPNFMAGYKEPEPEPEE